MKTLITLLVAVLLIGCTTTQNGVTTTRTVDPVKTSNVVFVVSQTAVAMTVRKEPDTRAYFQASVAVLDVVTAGDKLDPQSIREALALVEIGENEDTWSAITAALGIYQIYFGDVIGAQVDKVKNLRPVLEALREGIHAGLSAHEVGKVCEQADNLCADPLSTTTSAPVFWFNGNGYSSVLSPGLPSVTNWVRITNVFTVPQVLTAPPVRGTFLSMDFTATNRVLTGMTTPSAAVRYWVDVPTNTVWKAELQDATATDGLWTSMPGGNNTPGRFEIYISNSRVRGNAIRVRAVFDRFGAVVNQ